MKKLTKKQTKILEKVHELERTDSYMRECLAVKVCPECGGELTLKYKVGVDNVWGCSCGQEFFLM